ncbi:hypothetical protein [uncultured Tateyamaria sp.]|uniref:hypothetical protein n=1 Tax=Tateyamaria sp. 1078 TaxID=3417464 RepID=UPI00261C13C8|nr:hypothetical protein [uncultured Tateyamaria sp.]
MDIDEYLRGHGWSATMIVDGVSQAVRAFERLARPFDLVVLAAPHTDPAALSFIRSCTEEGCPVIVVNGALATAQPGQIVLMTRPFIDSDLDEAMSTLGLVYA